MTETDILSNITLPFLTQEIAKCKKCGSRLYPESQESPLLRVIKWATNHECE